MEKLTHDNECLTTLSEHLFQKFIDARLGLDVHKELADIEQYIDWSGSMNLVYDDNVLVELRVE